MSDERLNNLEEQAEAADQDQPGAPSWGYPAVRAAGFWLVLVAVLVAGVAIGGYLVPGDLLPGSPNASALAAAAEQDTLAEAIGDDVALAAEQSGVELEVTEIVAPALVFTIRAAEAGTCADFVGFEVDGGIGTVQVTPVIMCES